MKIIFIILGYIRWHYGRAIYSLIDILKNLLNFTFYYFSINKAFLNFFQPWKRLDSKYPKNFDFKIYLSTFIVNLIVRIIGMFMRSLLIVIGLIFYFIMLLLCPIILITWIILPFIIIFIFGLGIILIFK
jgi:hypothetical protein